MRQNAGAFAGGLQRSDDVEKVGVVALLGAAGRRASNRWKFTVSALLDAGPCPGSSVCR